MVGLVGHGGVANNWCASADISRSKLDHYGLKCLMGSIYVVRDMQTEYQDPLPTMYRAAASYLVDYANKCIFRQILGSKSLNAGYIYKHVV